MPLRTRGSAGVDKAQRRLALLKSIDGNLDLGHGLTIEAYSRLIDNTRAALESDNTLLSNLEESNLKKVSFGLFSQIIRFLPFTSLIYLTLAHFSLAKAQIIPDNTLGTESSVVNPDTIKGIPSDRIDGGAIRGANLFHSFSEFNIDSARGAYFTNPSGIENILTRVTGNNASQILGTLGVLGNANLFLINPNGIIFGKNAVLDIRGSFTATTADGIRLGENGLFSATNPQNSNLLTVKPGALFSNALSNQQATINNQGNLTVDAGQNINLLGANVINTGTLTAPEGKVQLTGTENLITRGNIATATLFLNTKNLTISENKNNDATVYQTTLEGLSGNTNLILQATNNITVDSLTNSTLNLADGSGKIAFIADADRDGIGNFQMNAADTIKTNGRDISILGANLTLGNIDTSFISNSGNAGNGGAITLTAGSNILTQSLKSYSYSANSGNAGNGGAITLISGGNIYTHQAILSYSSSPSGKSGNGGHISIAAQGDISIAAQGDIPIDKGINSSSYSLLETDGKGGNISLVSRTGNIFTTAPLYTASYFGRSGDISLEAAKDIRVGRTISTSRNNSGGNIKLISGNSISIEGLINSLTNFCSEINICSGNSSIVGGDIYFKSPRITSDNNDVSVDIDGLGKGGNLIIEADVLNISGTDHARFGTTTMGRGSGGNLIVNAKEVNLKNGGALQSITQGLGNAGNIQLTTNKLLIQDNRDRSHRLYQTGITTTAQPYFRGIIKSKLNNLNYLNYLIFANDDFKLGKVGDILINAAESIEIIGNKTETVSLELTRENLKSFLVDISAGITTGTLGSGEAGKLTINTKKLMARDYSGLFTGSIATKYISVILPNSILLAVKDEFNKLDSETKFILNSGGITPDSITNQIENQLSNLSDVGNGGDLEVNADQIILQGSGGLVTLSFSSGNAGNSRIQGKQISLQEGGFIAVSTYGTGNAGSLNIITDKLSINNGSKVFAGTIDKGFGGNINIAASESVEVIGTSSDGKNSSSIFAVAENNSTGNAGNITIDTPNLTIRDGARIEAQTKGAGTAGNIFIKNADFLDISGVNAFRINSGLLSSSENLNSGKGGTIIINQGNPQGILHLADGGFISVLTRSSNNGGEIGININNINIESGGQIISTAARGSNGKAGNIDIIANDRINIAGQNTPQSQKNLLNPNLGINSGLFALSEGTGDAGNISMTTGNLNITNEGKIFASTSGSGNGGTISVNALNFVNIGKGVQDFAPIISVETTGAGKAGNIIVNTPSLTVSDTASITATATKTATNTQEGGSITLNASKLDLAGIVGIFAETQGQAPAGTLKLNPYQNQPNLDINLFPNSNISASTSGSGKGGDLILTAPENINITGKGKLAVESTGIGDAGNILITTQNLNINDGVKISASTMNGQGGNININAHTLSANNGGQFLTTTSGTKKAGNINIQVRDNITLDGTNTGLFANTEKTATGDSGNITIDPEIFIIKNGAGIGVNSNGSGKGGNISLTAGTLTLDNQAFINAATTSNNGGEITLDIQDFLFVRRNSNITATAGTDFAGGNGGNITINSPFIIAIAAENSDITANAFSGQGGNINISTQGIFGIGFQAQQTAQSGITASSELGISGNVTINTPEVDPSKGLVQLSANLLDASRQIDNSCQAGSKQSASSFTITGRGGLPFNPYEYLQTDSVVKKWVTVDNNQNSPGNSQRSISENPSPQEIVEAQGLMKGENGDIYLVAQASHVIPHSPTLTAAACASSR
ncbi:MULTISPECIES: two-partner secretion domain-containing protein [Calothrix]|uniref:Filamentous hemagglutinin N-terminal domain-containing protein n=2 Tax=Calothrix TaxID=1186 RepID=A0ABR8A5G0_9CYAN|nr:MULTISPECIES: filamentous hemagglutinin N-terminal domain-containing protein [Calothrix]MBD2194725.1 filamentous hemagglutinin N-terminal domain-containing protein [Calothrix parietina FACHB-288]MBD2225125.1 filamentous hemagglutinin N-terminal domain-containing protein [Calothrix anomala FACHB-343]